MHRIGVYTMFLMFSLFLLITFKTKSTAKLPAWSDFFLIKNGSHEVPFHTSQNGCDPKVYKINAGEGVEKGEPSYTVGGNANQYSHYGEQCGDSLKNWK